MIIETAFHDIDNKDTELKNDIVNAIKYQPDYISVFPYYTKLAKKTVNEYTKISCPIDYPLGILDLKSRQNEIENAIKNGASKVDVVIPMVNIINRKYDKFREDIRANTDICRSNDVEIFYMLEYRIFNHLALTKLCSILLECGIHNVYSSTGYMLDDIADNTIACMYLAKKTKINTIINGNIWNKDQIKNLFTHKPNGIRFKNLHSLQLWYDYKAQTQ